MIRTAAALLLLAGVGAMDAAQTRSTVLGMPQRPPNAQAAPAPGTAVLRGHITAADTGQPLRKAQVRIVAPEIRENRMATTDADGLYEFKEVRAGRYTIMASKGSYVNVTYGQQRPFEPGRPLQILDNQTVERIDIALPRGSVITGRIVDEYGEPMPDVQISTLRYQFNQGRRQLQPAGRFASTNDLGEFRIFGLSPGQYYISATWRAQNVAGTNEDRTAYAPLYFPGTTNVAEAKRVTVDVGQQIDNMVMALVPVKATRITGIALNSEGKPIPGFLQVMQTSGGMMNFAQGAPIRPDGTFTINGLPPGDYVLRAQPNGPPGPDAEVATAKVTATGNDITDVRLSAAKPSSAFGRVLVDPGTTPPSNLSLMAFPMESGQIFGPIPQAKVAEDLTFELKSVPGLMRVQINGPATDWRIRAVRLNGIDIIDTGVEFKPNEDIRGLEIELTNRLTSISGLVTDSRGTAAKDYTAIVFSQDRERWTGASRYQSVARPDQDGRFKVTGLPPGSYYVIAVDYVDGGQALDPEFLERIRSRAAAFSLGEGETKSVDLRVTPAS